ncbi:MAG: cyclic nucleotide-binding domain-containing protein, partial [SAR324 cluster bacterium]|nr:cyclic nucleotide-binding domain-containing protein [SAR324 cluster bacterium]
VQEGKFGQNIYILIQGRLEVYLQTESGEEKQTDVIFKPFSIFGEQCIMGESNNASVESRGETLLLAIDMSALPDLFEGWETPDSRLEDTAYRQSLDMNMIFATVLLDRLNRLIRDQFKLAQKLLILHQSEEFQTSWKQNVLLTTLFNEFSLNQLSPNLEINKSLQQALALYIPQNQRLNELISEPLVNTEKVYLELARLESLGKINGMNILLMETIRRLSEKALTLDDYKKGLELQPHSLPAIISLPEFLNELFLAVCDSGVLAQELTKEQFLEGFLSESYLDLSLLAGYLEQGGWITSTFNMAYLMVLICQCCIRKEFELNRLIANCVAYLTTLNTPRQNTKLIQKKNQEDDRAITRELTDLFQRTTGDKSQQIKEQPTELSPQNSVEDLLSKFNL